MLEPRRPHRLLAGDLLEIEGRYFIDGSQVCADFHVMWLHPTEGVGGVYRPGGCGFDDTYEFGLNHLVFLVDATVLGDAAYDFAHDGAYFARDLRMSLVRDVTEADVYAALRDGPPYSQCSDVLP